jgi:S1/P1 Nuclease
MRRLIALSVLFLMLCPAVCRAWNSTGHEIIAQIAYDHLTPAARGKLVAILKFHPRLHEDLMNDMKAGEDADRAIFLRAATWPDEVRFPLNPLNRTESHPVWHYVDIPYDLGGVSGPQPAEKWDGHSFPENLFQAMDKVTGELADPSTPNDRKAIDLCWVEHLVGDIHQPLHATSLFSPQFPQGDKGGNLEMIRTDQGQVEPLHMFWDDVEGLSLDADVIRQEADRIEKAHPLSQFQGQLHDQDVIAWAKESYALAKADAYLNGQLLFVTRQQAEQDPASVPGFPAGYEKQALAVADVRMAQAGYRLADWLEKIAKGW